MAARKRGDKIYLLRDRSHADYTYDAGWLDGASREEMSFTISSSVQIYGVLLLTISSPIY